MVFGLEGEALTDFVRRSIYALLEAGAKPVLGTNTPNVYELQPQYGQTNTEIAEAVIREWLAQGAPSPAPWTGLWFGLPWSYERAAQ